MSGWRDAAACRDTPRDVFYPIERSRRSTYDAARDVCATCPVTAECLDWAMAIEGTRPSANRHGMWGGLTPEERASRHRAARKAETP